MPAIALKDCLRATPSRTLAALTLELSSRATRTLRRSRSGHDLTPLSDRTLADIGIIRADTLPAADLHAGIGRGA